LDERLYAHTHRAKTSQLFATILERRGHLLRHSRFLRRLPIRSVRGHALAALYIASCGVPKSQLARHLLFFSLFPKCITVGDLQLTTLSAGVRRGFRVEGVATSVNVVHICGLEALLRSQIQPQPHVARVADVRVLVLQIRLRLRPVLGSRALHQGPSSGERRVASRHLLHV
jgi:hypothetical protein